MSNVYFYYGDEVLIVKTRIERLIKEANIDEFNTSIYDLDEVSILDAIQDSLTMPFLTSFKAVIVKNPKFLSSEKSLEESELEALKNYITNPMDSTYFIIDAHNVKLDERKDIVKRLKKLPNAFEAKELTDIELSGWLKRQCSINNVTIKDDAIKTFFSLAGKNLLNAKNEIDKLISYAGPNGVITSDVVERVVVKEIQNDVFSLSNAIIEQNKPRIINIYRDLISHGNDVFYLFSLVAKSMKEILLVNTMLKAGYKQADVAQAMNVSPGRAFYMVKNARSLDIEVVEEYIIKLGNLDYQIKSGQVDAKAGFELFLFGL